MEKLKDFLHRKDIEISVKRYGIDALGAMAQGLFCSLLIGTIINTLGSQLHIPFLIWMSDSYREAFVMHRFKELSYKEIAEVLDVSPQTVAYRIQQALKLLRVSLKDYLPMLVWLVG